MFLTDNFVIELKVKNTLNENQKKIGSLLFLLAFLLTTTFGQKINSKDGVYMGERKAFIKSCIEGAKEKQLDIKGIKINTKDYCSCVSDKLIPSLNSTELQDAAKNGTLVELFVQDDNLKIIMECLDGNMKVEDEYEFGSSKNTELTLKVAKKTCIKEIMDDPEMSESWSKEMASEYCSCALEKLYKDGYTYKDLLDIENENGDAFNEIAVPCVTIVLANYPEESNNNTYNQSDIIGNNSSSKVELIDYLNQGFKLKISISGISKYFLFDTGASDLVIDREFERELLIEGALPKEAYIGKQIYAMANNEEVEADMVKLNNIKIGDYTINNVSVAILKEGSLLCGKGFLDKFRKWEVDQEQKVLTLYK